MKYIKVTIEYDNDFPDGPLSCSNMMSHLDATQMVDPIGIFAAIYEKLCQCILNKVKEDILTKRSMQ